jgi:hypothetical protein
MTPVEIIAEGTEIEPIEARHRATETTADTTIEDMIEIEMDIEGIHMIIEEKTAAEIIRINSLILLPLLATLDTHRIIQYHLLHHLSHNYNNSSVCMHHSNSRNTILALHHS